MKLSPETAADIKRRLWLGETQASIAEDIGMSVSLVGNIQSGAKWQTVAWPNGKIGPLPKSRKIEIAKARKVAKAAASKAVIGALSS